MSVDQFAGARGYLLVISTSFMLAACGSAGGSVETAPGTPSGSGDHPSSVDGSHSSATSTTLQPGDAINLEIWRQPDLSGNYRVDERGVVVLPLLGPRDVGGTPADSLRSLLVEDYSQYVRSPSIRVTLLRRINVLGEVRQPGLYPVDATVTLADAIAMAGGVAPTGDSDDIRLIRNGKIIRSDLQQATVIGSSSIRSGDQIVVGQRSWFERNLPIVTSVIGAASAVTVAIILN